jgi:hypothetical protein
MMLRRIVFWALLLVFSAACLVWFVYVPYRADQVLRPLPANASLVSRHFDLAARWDAFQANPLMRALLVSAGVDLEDLAAWTGDEDVRRWLDRLLARDVVLAYTPSVGPFEEPAWLGVSWIGGDSIRLRWLLQRQGGAWLDPIRRHVGDVYWLLREPFEPGQYVSLSVVEGMLLVAVSGDPHAIRHVLDVYDGIEPRSWADGVAGDTGVTVSTSTVPDRIWMGASPLGDGTGPWQLDLAQLDATHVSGSMTMATAVASGPSAWPAFEVEDVEPAALFFGDVPFFMLASRPDAVGDWVEERLPETVQQVWQAGAWEELIPPRAPLLLAASGRPYGGTVMGVPVPALVAAWPLPAEADGEALAAAWLDRLNARWRWGLLAAQQPVGARSMWVIESAAMTPYAVVRENERLAYSVVDGWFVLASHASALRGLLERYDGVAALTAAEAGGWLEPVRAGAATVYGFADIRAAADPLRMAISAYSIKLLFDRGEGSQALRQQLNAAQAWLDALEPMGRAQVWVTQTADQRTMRFQVGEPASMDVRQVEGEQGDE